MRILFLSRWYPYPPDNGSKIRVFSLLQGLCRQHSVTLISFSSPEEVADRNFLDSGPDETYVCAYREFNPFSSRALLGYLSETPRFLIDTYSHQMEGLIRRAVQRARYDLVIASQLSMASYYNCFRGIPAIFDEVELGAYKEVPGTSLGAGVWRRLTWAKHRRFVARVLKHYALCTVASEVERHLLTAAVPRFPTVHLIPNSIDVDRYCQTSSSRNPGTLIFPGSLRYAANYDAMTWFLREIYPTIQRELPDVQLTITGDPGLRRLPSVPNVILTGRIQDVHSLMGAAAVSLAPIRIGGGTRLKILESFALRTPVVTTTKGAEGLEAQDGKHLLVADTPRAFARAVLRLIQEPEQGRKIAENAFRLVRAQYDSGVVLARFMQLVEQAALSQDCGIRGKVPA